MTSTEIIQAIKAEIEKRISAHKTKNGFPAGSICAIRIETYEEILSLIDSLPEDKPSEDLEKAAMEYFDDEYADACQEVREYMVDFFRAGAQWQKEQMMEEWSEEDEEMLEYVIGDVNDAKQLFVPTKDAIDLCDKEIAWLKSLRGKFKKEDKQ